MNESLRVIFHYLGYGHIFLLFSLFNEIASITL